MVYEAEGRRKWRAIDPPKATIDVSSTIRSRVTNPYLSLLKYSIHRVPYYRPTRPRFSVPYIHHTEHSGPKIQHTVEPWEEPRKGGETQEKNATTNSPLSHPCQWRM